MEITIKIEPGQTTKEEIERWAQLVLLDSLSDFQKDRGAPLNCEQYMDKRYPVEDGGVYSKEPKRTQKLEQIQSRCRVAGALRTIQQITVEDDLEEAESIGWPWAE